MSGFRDMFNSPVSRSDKQNISRVSRTDSISHGDDRIGIADGYYRDNYERNTRRNSSSNSSSGSRKRRVTHNRNRTQNHRQGRSPSSSQNRRQSRSRSRDKVNLNVQDNARVEAARNHVYRTDMYKNTPPLSKYDALISLFDQRPEVFDTMRDLFSDKIVLINNLEELCVNASENVVAIKKLINKLFTDNNMFTVLRKKYKRLSPHTVDDAENKEIVLIYLDYVIDNFDK
jgi:hypothetical protein